MNPSTPETPAPLSFDSPAIKDALQHYNKLKPLPLADLSYSELYGLDLADALTHEHEARVRAEAGRDEITDLYKQRAKDCIKLRVQLHQAEAELDSLLEFERYVQKFGDYRKSFNASKSAALSGLPAQAGVKP